MTIITALKGLVARFSSKNTARATNGIAQKKIEIPSHLAYSLQQIMRDKEAFIYLMRMFWQARFDKMSQDYLPAMDWLSRTFLPPDVVATSYHYPSRHGPACLSGLDHYDLAKQVATLAYTRTC